MGNPYVSKRPRLILASNSQARAELLQAAGIVFDQRPTHIPEPRPRRGERFETYLSRLARLKAEAAAARAGTQDWVLAADTAIRFRSRILGKPGTAARARRMLAELQGRTHLLVTAVCVLGPAGHGGVRPRLEGRDSVRVTLRRLTPAAIRAYVATVQPLACAGAYALQGRGAAILKDLQGDPSTVVGLPLALTESLLRRAGFRPDRIRRP
jgi:septum formation protein